MKRRFVIGLTGGIATGKTTVLKEFARAGIPTLSSDALAHACLRPGHPVYRRVVRRFGRKILRDQGRICRRHLGRIVFAKPAERTWLERQIHPAVIRQLKSFIRKHRGLVALDIPLLFEARLGSLVDATLVVGSSRRSQIARMKRRDRLSDKDARQRIRSQLPLGLKMKRADYTLRNDGSRAALRSGVRALVGRLQEKGLTRE
ncbi:MAG: dephospho-CoA kinase [Elusimicrobia bacterium RIFCSPLOWO2_01_FULL_59_12]|nr:MAG: dephospho-CoA kinase [Elusimicrobia bacterium RIFCSPLOWO2_01_FULL_59_12]